MFERFHHDARDAVVKAQQEARALRHNYIGTEHLLLGLLHGSEAGARVLHPLGIDLAGVRSDVVRIVGRGPDAPPPPNDAEALRSIGIDLEEVRRRLEEAFGPGALDEPLSNPRPRWRFRRNRCRPVPGHIPFTPRAKKVLELSLREAVRLGHGFVGSGHVLLGLVREGEGIAAAILAQRGASPELVRRLVADELRDRGSRPGQSA